ncbi:hypothetical protein [Pararhizobium mangrovi]|uniref:Uncharacterized protein n=1 Tax=Pararhizobium mangrovi TaxID=2590452 RepID=A0A506U2E6_9HYPH|nr:hypothetical protein [Pararhizobium mangrovi]TPW26047.1 hypothetical protein FJU11_16675 [Pararhizobium mangrovi]
MARPLYDWPPVLVPAKALVSVSGAVQDGFISRAGYENDVRIPGGRVRLEMDFDYRNGANLEPYSWLVSKLKGSLFRVPFGIWAWSQVARNSDLDLPAGYASQGIPFATGAPFSSGLGFRFNPTVETAGTALEGENHIRIDESRWPGLLRYGKFIGIGGGCFHVEDVDRWDGDDPLVTVSPPFRRDIDKGEFVSLRPSIICKATDVSSFRSMFESADLVQPGKLVMMEAVVEDYV